MHKSLLLELCALKSLPRTGFKRVGVPNPETIASHSFGVALWTLLLCPSELDQARCLKLALVHDLAEVRVGDITPHDPVSPAEKHRRERDAFCSLFGETPGLVALFDEYEAAETAEARFVRALDKLDMGLQATAYAARSSLEGCPKESFDEFIASAKAALESFPDLLALLS